MAAMGMKALSGRLLARFGHRRVLWANAVLVAGTIAPLSRGGPGTPLAAIVALGLATGLFYLLQIPSMDSLACASLVAGACLGGLPQTSAAAVSGALHHAFPTLAAWTFVSSAVFWGAAGA